ncbi:MAG: hypothetical protein H6Q90_2029 [Deltaproteobacteria bacterium]|nr:hypothetical protein [Deltaproteobacteria bacterium]
MVPISSTRSFARFARGTLVVAAIACGGVALRGEQARACSGWEPSISELTTFDPDVLDNAGLAFDPFDSGFGAPCADDCTTQRMLADWHGYLKATGMTDADWKKVLFEASGQDLIAIRQRLSGKATAPPKGYEQSSLWKVSAGKDTLLAAIGVVELARKVEAFTGFDQYDQDGNQKLRGRPPAELLAAARKALKSTKDPFLSQRYGFLALRILFYQRDWNAAVSFFEGTQAVLATPSIDLSARARYYLAGALAKSGKAARANLELARVHASYPPLAGAAALDFRPMEDTDWRESLRLASTVREKTELWRLVGIDKDGLVAIQEILKLDPKSNLVGVLMVRELARAESRGVDAWGEGAKPDPKDVAAQHKAFAAIEQIAVAQAKLPGADRPWLMELIAGHIAAKRGDLATARPRLLRAVSGRPGDVRVASQAKASLAVALALDWKINPQNEAELAKSMNDIDPAFGRLATVRGDVRGKLAKAYAKAGKLVDAEFLQPGTVDPIDPATGRAKGKPRWNDAVFIKEMIARTGRTSTEFERFVLQGSISREHLEQELALRYLLDGDFATAAKTFQTTKATSDRLRTDPFVIHTIDCHDCDHDKFESSKWTHASMVTRLAELELKAKGGGEAAAEAAFLIGNALYNITWYGNARIVLDDSHQATRNASAALQWYKRAFDLTSNRELKARSAFMAAKAELANLWTAQADDPSANPDPYPTPKTWYPIVKRYAATKYYKEVLKECGYFATWASGKP